MWSCVHAWHNRRCPQRPSRLAWIATRRSGRYFLTGQKIHALAALLPCSQQLAVYVHCGNRARWSRPSRHARTAALQGREMHASAAIVSVPSAFCSSSCIAMAGAIGGGQADGRGPQPGARADEAVCGRAQPPGRPGLRTYLSHAHVAVR